MTESSHFSHLFLFDCQVKGEVNDMKNTSSKSKLGTKMLHEILDTVDMLYPMACGNSGLSAFFMLHVSSITWPDCSCGGGWNHSWETFPHDERPNDYYNCHGCSKPERLCWVSHSGPISGLHQRTRRCHPSRVCYKRNTSPNCYASPVKN